MHFSIVCLLCTVLSKYLEYITDEQPFIRGNIDNWAHVPKCQNGKEIKLCLKLFWDTDQMIINQVVEVGTHLIYLYIIEVLTANVVETQTHFNVS